MAAKLKGLHPQPLLNPPSEDGLPGWLRIGPGERGMVEALLESSRESDDGYVTAQFYHHAKAVGFHPEISGKNRAAMYERLKWARDTKTAWQLGDMHNYMRSIGLPTDLKADDGILLKDEEDARAGGQWLWAASMHAKRMGLGLAGKPAPEDAAFMAGAFLSVPLASEERLRFLDVLKRLGVRVKLTNTDAEDLRGYVERERRGDRADKLAEAHYLARSLLQVKPVEEAPPEMPPLRRFGR